MMGCGKRTPTPVTEGNPADPPKRIALDKAAPSPGVPVVARPLDAFPAGDLRPLVPPIDFEIGELSVTYAAGEIGVLGAFCEDLKIGRMSGEHLAPGRRALLKPSLESHLAEGAIPVAYRIGYKNPTDDGQVNARVRLFGREGHATGRVYLVRILGRWYVNDVQLNLAQLFETPPTRDGRFYPESYGDLFKGL